MSEQQPTFVSSSSFVKILRFLQYKASKTENLSIKDLLVASLLRFLQNNKYHKTMLNC